MSRSPERSRSEYVAYLQQRIEETSDAAVREKLETAAHEAAKSDRSISPLASLARVTEACDAIESGEAAVLARELGEFESKLRPGRTPINSQTVDAYIRLRFKKDQLARRLSEWNGPRSETMRRPGRLKEYLVTRQDAQNASRTKKISSGAKRVEELVGLLKTPEDRQDLRFALEKGAKAQRELTILRKAIEGGFEGAVPGPGRQNAGTCAFDLSDEQKSALARLRAKLQDNDTLRHFGLSTDGTRLKVTHSGGHFMDKQEYSALLSLLETALAV